MVSEVRLTTRQLVAAIEVVYSYGRASHDPLKRQKSVSTQLRENAAVCEEEGWPKPREFRDDGISASAYARQARDGEDGYDKMFALIAANKTDLVVVPASDRLSRSVEEWIPLRNALRDTATLLCVDGEIYDMRNSRHRAQITREIQTAEEEADRIRDRNARTTRSRAADGEVHGRPPYGYCREYHKRTKELLSQAPDPETAPVVLWIFQQIAERKPIHQIARELDEKGVPTPGRAAKWGANTLRKIGQNKAYEGIRVHGDEESRAVWKPIVTPLLARQARMVLAERAKPKHSNRSRWLLAGLARCGGPSKEDAARVCGGKMYHKLIGKITPTYMCLTCHSVSISQPVLDYYVELAALGWLEKPGRREQILAASGQDRAAEALVELRGLEAELEDAYALARTGELTSRGLAAREAHLRPRIKRATQIVEGAVVSEALMRMAAPDVREVVWPAAELPERREVLRRVVGVEVLPIGRGVRSARQVVARRTRLTWLLDQGTA